MRRRHRAGCLRPPGCPRAGEHGRDWEQPLLAGARAFVVADEFEAAFRQLDGRNVNRCAHPKHVGGHQTRARIDTRARDDLAERHANIMNFDITFGKSTKPVRCATTHFNGRGVCTAYASDGTNRSGASTARIVHLFPDRPTSGRAPYSPSGRSPAMKKKMLVGVSALITRACPRSDYPAVEPPGHATSFEEVDTVGGLFVFDNRNSLRRGTVHCWTLEASERARGVRRRVDSPRRSGREQLNGNRPRLDPSLVPDHVLVFSSFVYERHPDV